MHALTAPVLAAAGLLALAGALKLIRPDGTSQALRTQGLPSGRGVVRALGAAEIAVAAAALAQVPAGPVLLAVAYAGFTGFVLLALVRGRPLSSCGCFAEPDLPPTRTHLAVTGGFAVAAAAAASGDTGVPAVLDASLGIAAATVGAAALVAWLSYLALAELPRLAVAAAPPAEQPDGPQLFAILPVRSSTT